MIFKRYSLYFISFGLTFWLAFKCGLASEEKEEQGIKKVSSSATGDLEMDLLWQHHTLIQQGRIEEVRLKWRDIPVNHFANRILEVGLYLNILNSLGERNKIKLFLKELSDKENLNKLGVIDTIDIFWRLSDAALTEEAAEWLKSEKVMKLGGQANSLSERFSFVLALQKAGIDEAQQYYFETFGQREVEDLQKDFQFMEIIKLYPTLQLKNFAQAGAPLSTILEHIERHRNERKKSGKVPWNES